jgi:hypothetical protein
MATQLKMTSVFAVSTDQLLNDDKTRVDISLPQVFQVMTLLFF